MRLATAEKDAEVVFRLDNVKNPLPELTFEARGAEMLSPSQANSCKLHKKNEI